jgi:glycosyltransferase involved in cell wall biosynthesis
MALFSSEEAGQLEGKISAIPICVDPELHQPLSRDLRGRQIIHLGTMFWPPNIEGVIWFAEEVLPLIWKELPNVRFVVAGKKPPATVRELVKKKNGQGGEVIVTGFVENPLPLLRQSQVFVVPVRAGGGMRVKIINAWRLGIPVVSTTIGAEGLKVSNGQNIILADEPGKFAQLIVQLILDPAMADALGEAGRRGVVDHYDYRKEYDQFDTVYEHATGNLDI